MRLLYDADRRVLKTRSDANRIIGNQKGSHNMTKYKLDLSSDIQTQKFHAEFGFDINRYAALVKGNGNKVLYHLDGLDQIETMIDWLYNQKVISKSLDWFKGDNENKLKNLAWLDGVQVAIVDNYKLLTGDSNCVIVENEELAAAVKHYINKVKNHEY